MNKIASYKLIGKGQFTEAYHTGIEKDKVLLKSNDIVKVAMADGSFPSSRLFPTIEYCTISDDYDFETKFEADVASRAVLPKLSLYYQNMYRQLREFQYNCRSSMPGELNCKAFQRELYKLKGIKKYHKDAIWEAYNSLFGYEGGNDKTIRFEIQPKNVFTKNGKLVLNDCFFVI